MNTVSFPFLHEGLREINEEIDEEIGRSSWGKFVNPLELWCVPSARELIPVPTAPQKEPHIKADGEAPTRWTSPGNSFSTA